MRNDLYSLGHNAPLLQTYLVEVLLTLLIGEKMTEQAQEGAEQAQQAGEQAQQAGEQAQQATE